MLLVIAQSGIFNNECKVESYNYNRYVPIHYKDGVEG